MGISVGAFLTFGYTSEDEVDIDWDLIENNNNPIVDMCVHCSYEYTILFVHLRNRRYTNYKGSVTEISTLDLSITEEDVIQLKKCAMELGISCDRNPYWFLVSYSI